MNPFCRQVREDILRAAKQSGHGHIPSCFSVVEILCAVYAAIKHDPKNPGWPRRDLFILSKGHASLAHYCVLARLGYFDIDRVSAFGAYMSDFGCHADRIKVPGIEASTGSLGHGIALATGMALGLRMQKSDRRVYSVIGDGESNEGSVWEAIMVASDLKLDNLTVIYDNNMSHARGLQIPNPGERFASFGCSTSEVDGHDVEALKSEITKTAGMPRVIIARTRKGYGAKTLVRDHYEWHRRAPNDEEFARLMKELDEEAI